MDYKQKYEEALERAREYWETDNDNTLDIKAKGTMEYLFPELAESEDERIRKHLIDCVTRTIPEADAFNEISKEQILTWLEKQGEQKTYGQMEECADCQFNYAGECKGSCSMKRGEQKPFNYEYVNIPQKDFSPAIGIEIPFGAKDSELQEATYLIPEGFHAEINDDEVLIKKGKQKSITSNNAHIIDSALNDYCCKQYDALHKENGGVLSFARLQHLAMDIYGWCKEQGKQNPAWTEADDEELEIATNALKGAWQYDSAAWLLTLKQRIGE